MTPVNSIKRCKTYTYSTVQQYCNETSRRQNVIVYIHSYIGYSLE